jgi:hypothetical protein
MIAVLKMLLGKIGWKMTKTYFSPDSESIDEASVRKGAALQA